LAHEDMLVKKYREYMDPVNALAVKTYIKVGMAFGTTQLTNYINFGLMFFFAGIIIENSIDPKTKIPTINV
jgi:hypothetical protein